MNSGIAEKLVIGFLIVLLQGCTLFEPPPRSLDPGLVPDEFQLYQQTEEFADKWWTEFNSNELDMLMDKVFQGNMTIQEAYARLRQADANAVKSGAQRLPELNITGGYTLTEQESDTGGENDSRSGTDRYSAGLAVTSWEVDLWGRVRAGQKAADLDRMVSREDLRASYLSISTETASRWVERLVQRETLNLLEQQLESNRQYRELMEARFRLGQATALDIYQQRQSVALIESLIPDINARILELNNEIAVLMGEPPGTDIELTSHEIPELKSIPDPGLPADILAARPDIRKSGLALQSADWRLSAARADRLPAIRVSASMSYSAGQLDALFTNWIGTLAASLTGPIFDAGRRRAEVDRSIAVVEERLASYRQTVLNGLMEVQNTLIGRYSRAETLSAQQRQLEAARASWRESLDRYRKGTIDYLPVLTALTQAQSLERTVLQSRYQLILEQINLYKALGGPQLGKYLNAGDDSSEQTTGEDNEQQL